MKKFIHRSKGQYRALVEVSKNSHYKAKNTSTVVSVQLNFFVSSYRDYLRHRGNPWLIAGHVTNAGFRKVMETLFKSNQKAVSYIADLRKKTRGSCCAMCGSLSSSQIDHLLPQRHYPEFSIFLPNLFPICSCNQSKGNKVIGSTYGERFLHPTFDRKIGERGLYVRIRNHDEAPTYTVIARKPKGVRDAVAFDYHTRTLVCEDALSAYVRDGFERFCKRPGNVVRFLKSENPANKTHLIRLLRIEIDEACWQHQTKNNWESVMLQALIERRTVEWLWKRLSAPSRTPGSPLVRL